MGKRNGTLQLQLGRITFMIHASMILLMIRPTVLAYFVKQLLFRDVSSLDFIYVYLFSLAFGPLAVLMHELGHAVSYLLFNKQLGCVLTLSGAGGLLSVSSRPKIQRLAIVVVSGPFVNLLLSVAGICGSFYCSSQVGDWLLITWAMTNLTSFLGAMVPYGETDGARLLTIARTGSI